MRMINFCGMSSMHRTSRKRCVNAVPDSLYRSCLRVVTRNAFAFDPDVLCVLPVMVKTEILRQITRQSDCFVTLRRPSAASRALPANPPIKTNSVRLLQALLHPELLQLDLSSAATRLTGDQLQAIVLAAPNLCELKLNNALDLSTDDLLGSLSRLPRLRGLHVNAVPAMDDSVLQMLAARCPALDTLDVGRCDRITDGCVESMRGMGLVKLNMSETSITDEFLRQMAGSRFNEHLREINLGGCPISSEGLKHLHWGQLKYIGFEGAELCDLEFVKQLGNLKFMQWTIST